MNNHLKYILRLADNALILGQRLGEWCGHGPILEQDIAITNIALDHVGQARTWFNYAAELENKGRDEDQLAFLRDVNEYSNLLLLEQPNTDFAYTIVRQFLFDSFNFYLHESLCESSDETVRAVAQKSLKEITYHLRYSSEWMIRLGDGTEESHQKMQNAVNDLWRFAGESIIADEVDQWAAKESIGPDLAGLVAKVEAKRTAILKEATLVAPEINYMQQGGKSGMHTEHLGYILTEMQWLPRTHPGATW